MDQNIADFYDKIYSEDNQAFGGEPLPIVKHLPEYISRGDVLEIGGGAGRNGLFLASQGFNVTLMDISRVAIENILKKAGQENIHIKAFVADAVTADFEQEFDVVICTFILHHLTSQEAKEVIEKMQKHTKSGGFNILLTFTKNGDFYKNNSGTTNFYIDGKEDLEKFYTGWEILKLFEKEGRARQVTEDRKHMFNVFAGILAKKK